MPIINIDTLITLLIAFVLLYLVKKLFDHSAKISGIDTFRRFPSPFSALISLLLFVALVAAFMVIPAYFSHVFPDCWLLRNVQSLSLLELLLILTGSIALAWFIARFHPDFWMYSGFGTKMYLTDSDDSRSRIGTKWLVALLVPVLPIRSYEVVGVQQISWEHTEYATEALESIRWDHVMDTVYRRWWIYGLVALGIIADIAFSVFGCL